jgi:hypothetical protein
LLLENSKPDLSLRTANGETPCDLAVRLRHTRIAECLTIALRYQYHSLKYRFTRHEVLTYGTTFLLLMSNCFSRLFLFGDHLRFHWISYRFCDRLYLRPLPSFFWKRRVRSFLLFRKSSYRSVSYDSPADTAVMSNRTIGDTLVTTLMDRQQ